MIASKINWVGRRVADGRYRIIGRLDKGSMGHVYRAHDRRLETEVVLKFPVAADATLEGPEFLERFSREIRSLVRLSHPHIVRIIDVGAEGGEPYVVMPFLTGGSLKARMETGPGGEPEAMPPRSLAGWLPEIAAALDFIHAQGYVHRDVKPANLMFDEHGHAFLGDFGLIKALASEPQGKNDSSLTGIGLLVGTPNYIAPEVVMGRPVDGRADQYSLAMTVHEVLTGRVFLEGPTPSATMVNQTKVRAPALADLVPGVPRGLSDAVTRALAKDPGYRYASCVEFAREALAGLAEGTSSRSGAIASVGKSSRGKVGQAPCPSCRAVLPVLPEHQGKRVRCSRCRAISLVEFPGDGGSSLTMVHPPSTSQVAPRPGVASLPGAARPGGARPATDPSMPTLPGTQARTPPPGDSAGRGPGSSIANARRPSGKSGWGKRPAASRLVAESCTALALLLATTITALSGGRGPSAGSPPAGPGAGASEAAGAPAEINIAYGTEKEKWLRAALKEFEKTPAGKKTRINLVGLGSVEGARAVLDGPNPGMVVKGSPVPPIHAWSPASSAYRAAFEKEWALKSPEKPAPIARARDLVLTPMVFVMWKHRYEPFVKKYGAVNFKTIGQAMREPGGWGAIAGKPEWGRFKFAHTDPNLSNSGMLSLALMAYAFAGKDSDLTLADITRAEFRRSLRDFELGLTRQGGKLVHSTGDLMKEMVLRGPSQYDCLMLYENLAIDYLKAAEAKQGKENGELRVAYPDPNLWNEHPYYVLDVPWSDAAHRAAAAEFLDFLVTKPVQANALTFGFRPTNDEIPLDGPESPLVKAAGAGVTLDIPRACEPPPADVITDLLSSSRRIDR